MSAQVLQFPSQGATATPVGVFLRLGEAGARAIGDLVAAGHLLPERVVVDASSLEAQRDLIQDLRLRGVEIVLDTKVAELGARSLSTGKLKSLPWAFQAHGAPLGPEHFGRGANTDVIDAIARFCVFHKVDAVISPSHWLGDPNCGDWLSRDVHSAGVLRDALDRQGGKGVAIDFGIIAPHTLIKEPSERSGLIKAVRDCPVENVWLRASGMKSTASALSNARHIEALAAYQELGFPLVADCLGGLVGLSLLAFGAVSGVSHGIGRYTGFDARAWHKEPRTQRTEDEGPRSQRRILLSEIGRSLTAREVECLAGARGGRKLISCNDRECCPSGFDDMLRDPRRHAAKQMIKMYQDLERVPDLKRPDHLIHNTLENAARKARSIARLKPEVKDQGLSSDKIASLVRRMEENSDRLDKVRTALENLQSRIGEAAFSPTRLRQRQAQRDLFDVKGRC